MQSKRRVSVVSVTSAGILDRHTVSGNCKTAKLTIEPTIHTGLRRASVGRYLFNKPSLFYSSSPYATQRNFRSLIYVRKSFTTNEVWEGRKAEFCVQVEGQKKSRPVSNGTGWMKKRKVDLYSDVVVGIIHKFQCQGT